MAEGSQETVFHTEEERDAAIEALEETSENEEKLTEYMDAQIVPKTEEADKETPANLEGEQEEQTPIPKPEGAPPPEPIQSEDPVIFTLEKGALPEKYKTPGEAFKALQHGQDLIERQAAKIQEEQAEKMRLLQEIESLKTQPKTPQNLFQSKVTQSEQQAHDNYLDKIGELQNDLSKIDDQFSEEYNTKSRELMNLQSAKLRQNDDMLTKFSEEIAGVKTLFETQQNSREQETLQKQMEAAQKADYEEAAMLSKEQPEEFGISKALDEIDKDYIKWAEDVHTQYFKSSPQKDAYGNMRPESWQKCQEALEALKRGAPTLINDCKLSQIPIAPTEDIKKYLNICELMNYKDGQRGYDANGKPIYATRFDPVSKKTVKDTFPSLKAAYEYKRVQSGYYKQKELSAYDKGSKEALAAAQRRDTNELQNNETGKHNIELTEAEIMAQMDTLEETEANIPVLVELQQKLENVLAKRRDA